MVTEVANDEEGPITLTALLARIKNYGHLFGWQTRTLPDIYFENQVAQVVAQLPDKVIDDMGESKSEAYLLPRI